jgi:DNA-binding transcriptional MerR regulator
VRIYTKHIQETHKFIHHQEPTTVTNNNEIAQSPEGENLYPIRTVSSMTGVNPITLRAWERRYGLIRPERTQSRRRLYTQHDIDQIHQILTLLDEGITISQVSKMLKGKQRPPRPAAGDRWAQEREQMIAAITRFDEDALNRIYNEALAQYPIDIVTRRLVMPLLEELGRRWTNKEGSIAEEHFFGVYLRNKLGARFHYQSVEAKGARILAACLPGEQHEIGLLLFALAAQAQGYRFILLGADLPIEELRAAARHSQARAIVLSATLRETLERQLTALARLTADLDIPVFIGGACTTLLHDEIGRAGAIPLGGDINQGLRLMDTELG